MSPSLSSVTVRGPYKKSHGNSDADSMRLAGLYIRRAHLPMNWGTFLTYLGSGGDRTSYVQGRGGVGARAVQHWRRAAATF